MSVATGSCRNRSASFRVQWYAQGPCRNARSGFVTVSVAVMRRQCTSAPWRQAVSGRERGLDVPIRPRTSSLGKESARRGLPADSPDGESPNEIAPDGITDRASCKETAAKKRRSGSQEPFPKKSTRRIRGRCASRWLRSTVGFETGGLRNSHAPRSSPPSEELLRRGRASTRRGRFEAHRPSTQANEVTRKRKRRVMNGDT